MPVEATEIKPKLVTLLFSFTVMLFVVPLPTVAPGWTVTASPSWAAVNPLGDAPLQFTVVPS
jgi:hypothetical protein